MNLHVSEDPSAVKKSCVFEPYRKHKNIGKCLIISNEHFVINCVRRPMTSKYHDDIANDIKVQCLDSPRLHRRGGSVDERLLSSTFKSLGFQVQVEKNLSANEMISVLRKVSKENHKDNSCFVCVLMSHGEEGTILGSDERWIHVKTLTSLVSSDLCPSLQDKPKLFFLQACRGLKFDAGVEADGEEEPGEFLGISDVPEADFLCCYSTVEGYYSWRNPETGSVFIGELCKMLKECHLEIIQILTRVNHRVAFHFQSHTTDLDTHIKRQMPCFASKLTKDFYLHVAEKKKR